MDKITEIHFYKNGNNTEIEVAGMNCTETTCDIVSEEMMIPADIMSEIVDLINNKNFMLNVKDNDSGEKVMWI